MDSQVYLYADVDRDLPDLSPAERCCVLAGLLNKGLAVLHVMANHRDQPKIENVATVVTQVFDCFGRLRVALDAAQLDLREIHRANGRQVRISGQSFGSYCHAVESIGEGFCEAIIRACSDDDLLLGWLAGNVTSLPDATIQGSWDKIAPAVADIVKPDFEALHLGATNEHIEATLLDKIKTAADEADGKTDGKTDGEPECYVTLLQMAAIVNRSKTTLRRLYDAGDLLTPAVNGEGGSPNEWRWADVRPILEEKYGKVLPKFFPADKFVR
jgi:hypothetical protein